MEKIKVCVVGYGNVGKGVKEAVKRNLDMELVAIITKRPREVKREVRDVCVFPYEKYRTLQKEISVDVAILCGASKDLPVEGPKFSERFNTVDGFDIHEDIPKYFGEMDFSARRGGNVSVISAGWDPGIFSVVRVLGSAFVPLSKNYTFWGPGISLGHSAAAKRVEGVKDARAYTIPIKEAIDKIRSGERLNFSKREMHKRLVYIVAEEDADLEDIREKIVNMPKYYDEYDTEVKFIDHEEMNRRYSSLSHRGFVITSGLTSEGNKVILEYLCEMDSNPEFTASVLLAYARAAHRLKKEGRKGAFTSLDIPASYLHCNSVDMLRKDFL